MPILFDEKTNSWSLKELTEKEAESLLSLGLSFLSGIIAIRVDALAKAQGIDISGESKINLSDIPDENFFKS